MSQTRLVKDLEGVTMACQFEICLRSSLGCLANIVAYHKNKRKYGIYIYICVIT